MTLRQLRRKRGVSTNLSLMKLMQRMTSKLQFWISLNKSESQNKSACPQVSSIIGFTLILTHWIRKWPSESYHSHSQSTKCLRSHIYTKKTKNYSNIYSPSYDSQISFHESLSDEEYSHFPDEKVHFLTPKTEKVSTTLINPTRIIKSQHPQLRDLHL